MKLALHWQILIALTLGVGAGLALSVFGPAARAALGDGPPGIAADWIAGLVVVLGDLFKRALQVAAVPIVLLAMMLAVPSLGDARSLGRIGGKTLALFAATALTSVLIGLALVNLVRPGGDRFIDAEDRQRLANVSSDAAAGLTRAAEGVRRWDLLRQAVPTNPFDALARGDMLQVVVIAVGLGIALALLPAERSAPVLAVLRGLSDALILIVRGIMRLAPIGVFCLITPVVATLGLNALAALAAYCATVLAGLAAIQLIIYPLVVRLFSDLPLGAFFTGLGQAQVVAFSSSSSAATLPVTIAAVRDRLGVRPEIAGFVCAVGAKLNMDGTALMQAVAAVFLAQFYGIELSAWQQASIVLLAVASAIGSPGIPSGGMIMLVVLLKTAGIPAEGIAMILAVDRVLDMCRTVVNVTGDAAVAVAVNGRAFKA
jgi:Na+/H+-dicarboxylate symporter